MSKVICKGKYTPDVKYFLNTVEYAGEKIHSQKIHFKDGRIEDIQDDTKIDFSKYDVREIEKISFVLKDSDTHINMSVEKYQEKIKKPKASIKTSNILEVEDVINFDEYIDSETDTGFLGYIDYTANRLGVEKEGGIGLFGVKGNIGMEEVEKLAYEAYDNGVRIYWMDIVSISREDGDRLGFDNRQAWKDLIISKAPDIAKAYNIPFENFQMYTGFHTNHESSYHIHMSFHSMSPKDGYIKNGAEGGFEKASDKVKSIVLNTIFKDDVSEIKSVINTQRKNILQMLNNAMTNEFISDKLSNSFTVLAKDLKQYENGKSKYGYLKPTTKELVANVLKDIMAKDIDFKKLSAEYFASCEKQVRFYIDNDEQVNLRMEAIKERFLNPDYHNNDSTAIHNTIIKFANKYNISDLPSQSRAIKGKIEFYDTPQENASDDFTSYEKIPDITDESPPTAIIMVFSKQVLENKLNTEFKAYLNKTLIETIKEESLIETQISQELQKIFKSEKFFSNEESLSIARTLYHLDNTFKSQMDDWVQKLQGENNRDIVAQFTDIWSSYEAADERMTKLFLSSPIGNAINGFGKNILNSYQKHHLANFKELQKSICKETQGTLIKSINNNDTAARLFSEVSLDLKVSEKAINYENTTAKIQTLMSNLAEENPEINRLINNLKSKMLSEDYGIVPKGIMEDYKRSVERSFSNGSLSFSFNAMLFGMAREAEKTYANAAVKLFEKEYKELREMVSNQVYKAMQLPRSKLERDELYSIVEKMGEPSIEKEEKELLTRQAVIYMLKNNKKLAEAVNYLESKFNETTNGIEEDKKHQLFNDVFLFDSYTGVASTVAYMADKQDTLMTEIQATKKKIIIKAMCQAVAQIMYSNTRENERKFSHNNDEKKNLSKKRGNFSNKRSNLSSDLTFNNL